MCVCRRSGGGDMSMACPRNVADARANNRRKRFMRRRRAVSSMTMTMTMTMTSSSSAATANSSPRRTGSEPIT